MGPFEIADLGLAAWLIVASATLVFMVRRGHNPTRWAVISFLTGPLAIVFAAWARHRAGAIVSSVSHWGRPGSGPLNIVVGVDGSDAAHEAAVGAVVALGERIGRLTLAIVIDFESATAKQPAGGRLAAESTLAKEAEALERIVGIEARRVVLAGAPAKALVDHAQTAGDHWIVIGVRGEGEADWLQGSVAEALSSRSPVPVMVIGGTTGILDELEAESADT